MEHNTIEIEFISPGFKNQFKQLVGNDPGPFFEKLFPWPTTKLHGEQIKAIDFVIWSEWTRGLDTGCRFSKLLTHEEQINSITYTYSTSKRPSSYRFIRHLAFMFPIRYIKLTHYTMEKHVCIQAKHPNGSYKLNCAHQSCQKYALPRVYELNWRNLPHPIYEVHRTMNEVINGGVNPNHFMDDESGPIYHHLIFENTLISFFDSPAIAKAESIFKEQALLIGSPYLTILALTDTYLNAPDIEKTKALKTKALSIEKRYSQPRNKPKNIKPLQVRK